MRRREIHLAPEQPAENPGILVAHLMGDRFDWPAGLGLQHLSRLLEAQSMHILDRRMPVASTNRRFKVRSARSESLTMFVTGFGSR